MDEITVNGEPARWIGEGYAISPSGIVWSFWKPGSSSNRLPDEPRNTWHLRLDLSPRRLAPTANGNGYLYARLGKHGEQDYIHRWVWRAWCGPIPGGQQVRHYDRDKTNNTLTNLRLGSVEQNAADKAMHDTHPVGERAAGARVRDADIIEARQLYRAGMTLKDILGALNLPVTIGTLSRAVTGSRWTHLDHIESPIVPGRHNPLRGEVAANAKLTDELVIEARRMRRETDMTLKQIIDQLNLDVTVYGLNGVLVGRSWKHLNHIAPPVRRMAERKPK